jgi:pimeloyl-ACP methyl ester carboxylesterase
MLVDLARRLARNPNAVTAAQLTRASLQHRHELPRVAAAAAHAELASDPAGALAVLGASLDSADPLVARLAATALARIAPEDERLRVLLRRRPSRSARRRSHTSLLVHGTFARSSTWWQPGGDFHEYLRTEVRPDLYSAADRFEWSGGWSDAARAVGAADLRAWVDAHGLEGLDLFTHSHGGSVAMLASQGGLTIGELVMLSCPVHVPEYVPDFTRVSRAISIRVHMDLVILVDGGGQKFQDPRIEEHVLPIWFDHFATHDPQVWRDHDVPSLI